MIEWLTTIPGILIICGILLLIIAIILFVVGAKKARNEEVVTNSLNNINNSMNSGNTVPDVNTGVVPSMVTSDVTVSQAEPVSIVSGVETTPVVEPQVVPEVPVELNNQEVVADIPVAIEQQPVDMGDTQVIDTTAVYGGEMPKVDFVAQEEKPVTIYGGNDPLEATQTFPTMEENHVPYGGNYSEIKINEPAVETIASTPVSEETVEMPVIEPVIETVTEPVVEEVVSVPTVEPVVEEVVTIPTNEVGVVETASNVEEL